MQRNLIATVERVVNGLWTTPPKDWWGRWKERHVTDAETRDEYLQREAVYKDDQLLIGGLEIMQGWERPVMKAMAEVATRNGGHVLEVGFGMGISAGYLIESGAEEYTVIEPHPGVLEKIRTDWAPKQPVPVHVEAGFWEDILSGLGTFDAILFDTYPVTKSESENNVLIREFIPEAAKHLRDGGIFTFYGAHSDELPQRDLDLIHAHFSKYESFVQTGLQPPKDCQYFESDRMVVPICIK